MLVKEHSSLANKFIDMIKNEDWHKMQYANTLELIGFYLLGFISKQKAIEIINNRGDNKLTEKEFDERFLQLKCAVLF